MMEILSSDFFGIIVFALTLSIIGIDEDYYNEDYEKPKLNHKQTYEEYVDERLRIEKKIRQR